jgi:hypothetical protein
MGNLCLVREPWIVALVAAIRWFTAAGKRSPELPIERPKAVYGSKIMTKTSVASSGSEAIVSPSIGTFHRSMEGIELIDECEK